MGIHFESLASGLADLYLNTIFIHHISTKAVEVDRISDHTTAPLQIDQLSAVIAPTGQLSSVFQYSCFITWQQRRSKRSEDAFIGCSIQFRPRACVKNQVITCF